jgi:HEAT repeat protein
MFKSVKAYSLHRKLQVEKGKNFVTHVFELSNIKSNEALRYLLDIVVSRDNLNSQEKAALAYACAAFGEDAIRYLINEIYSPTGGIQYSVVSALGNMKEKEAVPVFIFLLEQTNDPIFAYALGEIGDGEAATILRGKVLDPSVDCRLESLEALAKISVEENLDLFTLILGSSEYTLQKCAAESISAANIKLESDVNRMFVEIITTGTITEKLESDEKGIALLSFINCTDEKLLKDVLLILSQSNFHKKGEVATQFCDIIHPSLVAYFFENVPETDQYMVTEEVFSLLSHNIAEVRAAVEKFLLRQGEISFTIAFNEMVKESAVDRHQHTALLTIAAHNSQGQKKFLKEKVKSKNKNEILTALEIIAESGDNSFSKDIVTVYEKNEDKDIHIMALNTLGLIGDKNTVDFLFKQLKRDEAAIRMAAFEALVLFELDELDEQLKREADTIKDLSERDEMLELLQ